MYYVFISKPRESKKEVTALFRCRGCGWCPRIQPTLTNTLAVKKKNVQWSSPFNACIACARLLGLMCLFIFINTSKRESWAWPKLQSLICMWESSVFLFIVCVSALDSVPGRKNPVLVVQRVMVILAVSPCSLWLQLGQGLLELRKQEWVMMALSAWVLPFSQCV